MNKEYYEQYIGKKINNFTIIGVCKKPPRRCWNFSVECICGEKRIIRCWNILNGKSKSCGCVAIENARIINTTHGKIDTPLYGIWGNMKTRCTNENVLQYENYGGRGITVCDEWKNDFMEFYNWAHTNGYEEGLTIERKDVNGNYCPENCCWVTLSQQAKNKQTTIWAEIDGEKMCLKDACKKVGLPYKAVHLRIKRSGWDIDKALHTPLLR